MMKFTVKNGRLFKEENDVYFSSRIENTPFKIEADILAEKEEELRLEKEKLLQKIEDYMKEKLKERFNINIRTIKFYNFILDAFDKREELEERVCYLELDTSEGLKKILMCGDLMFCYTSKFSIKYFDEDTILFEGQVLSNDPDLDRRIRLLINAIHDEIPGYRTVRIY